MTFTARTGPLEDITIIDCSMAFAGPFGTALLADLGANVIKVEPPMVGDLARYMGDIRNGMAAMFSTLNRNKRSLVLDLKDAADMEIFLQLVPTADVLIENLTLDDPAVAAQDALVPSEHV